jgi:tetratricopeptide (TPR) repeat protein
VTYTDAYSDSTAAPAAEPLVSPRRLTQLALLLVIVLVIARATINEILRDPFEAAPGQAYTPVGPGPAVSLVLSLMCFVPALLVLARRVLDPEYRLARVWSPLVWVGLGVFALVSTAWASDRFAAAVHATTFAAAGAIAWAAAQTVRSWARFRLVSAVLAALLMVYLSQGIYYRQVELPDLQRTVERQKERILQERGFEPGSFAATQFLQRITSGEMVGFGASPNSYAACLVMLGLVGLGVVVQGVRDKRDAVLLVLPVAAVALTVYVGLFTRSRTAALTPVVGVALVAMAIALRPLAARFRKGLFLAGVGGFTLAAAGVVVYGLQTNSLPGDSLNFRWRYWVASWELFQEHLARGVGYANFGASYLAHRLPAAAEEIRDPHNLFVRFACELGLAGVAACVLWLLATTWEASRPALSPVPKTRGLPVGAIPLALAATAATFINVVASVDFSADWAFVTIEMFKRLMFLGVMIVGGSTLLIASRNSAAADDRPGQLLPLFFAAGAFAFLLHNLIDFAIFEPAPMVLSALLVGALLGVRAPDGDRVSASRLARPAAGVAVVVLACMLIAAFTRFVFPVLLAEGRARLGDQLLREDRATSAAAAFEQAFATVPYNGHYASRAARAHMFARGDLGRVRALLDAASNADPMAIRPLLDRARLETQLPADLGDLASADRCFRRALELNPNEVVIRLDLASLLERLGKAEDAREQIRTALRYDDLLDAAEPKRLSPEVRREWTERAGAGGDRR